MTRFATLFAVLILSLPLLGQDTRARINGRVVDPAGAIIPDVTVELTQLSTGTTRSTASNGSGAFDFNLLDSGDYRLRATVKGFKTYVREPITLETGQTAGIEIGLQLGTTSETVEVAGTGALLDTESATRGLVLNQKLVQELPLRARNPLLYVNLLPGTTFRGAGVFPQPFANGAIVNITINGGSPGQNELLVDGAQNTARAAGQQNNVALTPIAESVREVAVVTNAYDASYGRTSGGVVNIVTRGGTSEQHAAGWGYLRRDNWNANLYPLNAIGAPKPVQEVNQYGFQIDGPVYIPKLLRKDSTLKLFYLASWEKYNELTPQPIRVSVPTADMRNGDFSKLTNANGDLVRIFDPASGRTDSTGAFVRDQFPGSIIPTSRISPVAAAVSRYFPQPNDPGLPRQRAAQGNFNLPTFSYPLNYWTFNLRFDAAIGSNDRIFFRWSPNRHTQERTLNGILGSPGENGFNPFLRENNNYLLDYVRTLNPTTVLNVRAGCMRYVEGNGSNGNFGFQPASLGLPASLGSQLAVGDFFGLWNFSNYSPLGSSVSYEYNNAYTLFAGISKVWGQHTLKAGLDVRRLEYLTTILGNIYQVTSDASRTRRVWDNAASEVDSGDSFASFLLGAPASGSADFNVRPYYRSWYIAPYVHDDWKVNPKLTLSFGLRYDINTAPLEKYNRLVRGFDPNAPSPIAGSLPASALAQYPQLRDLRGGLQFAGVDGNGRRSSSTYGSTFQPRFGFAYKITNRLVARGGYGMFYANWPNGDYYQSQGFSTSTAMVTSADGGRTGIPNVLSNPFPGGIQQPVGSSLGLNTFAGRNFTWWNPNAQLPRVHQFSFGFQVLATRNSALDLAYVGSRTQNLITTLPANNPSDAFIATCDPARGGTLSNCNGLVSNPFRGLPQLAGTALGANAQITRLQLARPYPQFDGDLPQAGRNDARMWYNAAQIIYKIQPTAGLVLNLNYTFSKQVAEDGTTNGWLNVYSSQIARGLTQFDRTHQWKLAAHYELPFGKGRKFLSGSNGFIDRLVNGWDLNAFYTASSGEPADLPGNAIMIRNPAVAVNRNQAIVRGWTPCVLQQAPNGTVSPTRASTTINGCSPTDFSQYDWLVVPQGFQTFRTNPLRSGNIRMPAAYTADLSLNKTIQIAERVRFQFRAEAFNAFNHYNVFSVRYNTNPLDPNGNFGTYLPSETGSFSGQMRDSPPRAIQLGMKLLW